MNHANRLDKLRKLMQKNNVKTLLITKSENIYYLSGLYSTSAALIIAEAERYILTDARYFLRAQELSNLYKPVKVTKGLMKEIIKIARSLKIKKMSFEENCVSCFDFKELNNSIKLKESGGLVEILRQVKDNDEIKNIKKAGKIIKKAMNDIKKEIVVGSTEKEIASKLNSLMFVHGADGIAFPTIVAAGSNAAVPHHETSNRKIKEGDIVLIDAGTSFNHYNSDMTRTFVAGKPSEKQREIINIVKEAQAKAIKAVSSGIKIKELDKKARNLIEYSGYGNCFTHGLGHSIGLEVHEAPSINKTTDALVKSGNVFTIEPAIYIEDFGGVRIEDTVLVTDEGVEVLT